MSLTFAFGELQLRGYGGKGRCGFLSRFATHWPVPLWPQFLPLWNDAHPSLVPETGLGEE